MLQRTFAEVEYEWKKNTDEAGEVFGADGGVDSLEAAGGAHPSVLPASGAVATIKLQYPLEFRGAEVKEIAIRRRPLARDIEKMANAAGSGTQLMLLAADLTEQPPDLLRELDAADFMALQEAVADFLPGARRPEISAG